MLVGVGYQVFVSGGLGVLQVGMSKFVQHTNWGSYKLGCPSLFNIPTTSLKKNLINHSQGGARFLWSPCSGALTIVSWPPFHQDTRPRHKARTKTKTKTQTKTRQVKTKTGPGQDQVQDKKDNRPRSNAKTKVAILSSRHLGED